MRAMPNRAFIATALAAPRPILRLHRNICRQAPAQSRSMRAMTTAPQAFALDERATQREGLVAALLAYTLWGVLPVYFKITAAVPALELLAHRVVWAVPFGAVLIAARHQLPEVTAALRDPRRLGWLTLSATLIGINWLLYIYAVQTERIAEASLGYYINPLVYIVVGVVFFGEQLGPLRAAAVALAGLGVAVLTISGGQFPAIALTLAVSFTIYGVIRKRVAVGAMPGLFVETLVLFPLTAGYLGYVVHTGQAAFDAAAPGMAALLVLAGPVTVVPLLFFALAARRLHFSTLGFMQFLAPSLQFLMALYYGEPMTLARWICFALIWAAAALFVLDISRRRAPADR